MRHREHKLKPYASYPFILRGRQEICNFLRISINTLQEFIDMGAPIKIIGGVYIADKMALRQWLGVKVLTTIHQRQKLSAKQIDMILEELRKNLTALTPPEQEVEGDS